MIITKSRRCKNEISQGGLVWDATNGDLYIADSINQAVRKLTVSTGVLSTVAGQLNLAGDQGDNGPATSARLNQPAGLDRDEANGDLYIVDQQNHIVRKVDGSSGTITHVASATFCGHWS